MSFAEDIGVTLEIISPPGMELPPTIKKLKKSNEKDVKILERKSSFSRIDPADYEKKYMEHSRLNPDGELSPIKKSRAQTAKHNTKMGLNSFNRADYAEKFASNQQALPSKARPISASVSMTHRAQIIQS